MCFRNCWHAAIFECHANNPKLKTGESVSRFEFNSSVKQLSRGESLLGSAQKSTAYEPGLETAGSRLYLNTMLKIQSSKQIKTVSRFEINSSVKQPSRGESSSENHKIN